MVSINPNPNGNIHQQIRDLKKAEQGIQKKTAEQLKKLEPLKDLKVKEFPKDYFKKIDPKYFKDLTIDK